MVKTPDRQAPRRRVFAVAALSLVALALIGGFSAGRPVPVIIDGREQMLVAGTTVADLRENSGLIAAAGDLVNVGGGVLEARAGEPPTIHRNGGPVAEDTRLYEGDSITSFRGADVVESLETTLVAVPFETVYEGEGPISEFATEGTAGQRRITRGTHSGIEVTSALVRKPINAVVTRVQPRAGDKIVALTFDDGPWPLYTEQILDILRDEQVKATFFMLGSRVQRQPDVARRIVLEGHMVGNHSMNHTSFATASPKEVERQITKGRTAIQRHIGVETNWIRPPYGAMDAAAWKVTKQTRSRVVRWSVDSSDWRKPGAKKIAEHVVRQVKPGAVVLFHDGGGDRSQTVKALPQVIKKLKAKGYIFVTVEELYKAAAAEKQTS